MTSKYIIIVAVIVFTTAVVVSADKDWKGKKHGMMACLTDDARQAMWSKKNETMKECFAEAGLTLPTASATGATEMKEKKPKNMCFLQCLWVKEGLVKDGAFDTETFVKANVKTEFQEKVLSSFQTCLKEKGLTVTYTASKDDNCEGLKEHAGCAKEAMKVCKGDSSGSDSASNE